MARALILLFLLGLTSCAQPFEGRVATRLEAAGIPRPMAQCMAERWIDRLDVSQLRKIQALTNDITDDYEGRRLTVIGFVDRVRQLDDPEILSVVSTSAARCALR